MRRSASSVPARALRAGVVTAGIAALASCAVVGTARATPEIGDARPEARLDRVPAVAASTPAADTCPATRGRLVLDLVNRRRAEADLPALQAEAQVLAAAMAHARDLSTRPGRPGHSGSDGSEPADRLTRTGYEWGRVGENVAAGTPTPGTVVAMWMDSPGHRHNILTPEFRHAAVAYVDAPSSEWGTYWVMVYATLQDGAPESVLRCHP